MVESGVTATLLWIAGGIYLTASVMLFAFGANLARFSILVLLEKRSQPESEATSDRENLPLVTVQLPIYNELFVAERVIAAAVALEYPRDRMQIQVLDDSTDETSELVAVQVTRARAEGTNIVHLRRDARLGFKAGALNEGLKKTGDEFVAVFDADFVPRTDFLTRVLPGFDDENVAFVQARWGHLNAEQSPLTRLQALAIDAHFMVEQSARGRLGYWFNFNGTCGVWRVEAIRDAGGWSGDTLTEDLDLSYRAHLRGWTGRYLESVVAPGELPMHISSFRRQQHRWARGSIECAVKHMREIWRSEITAGTKFQASAHLGAYGVHLLLLLLTLLYPAVVLLSEHSPWTHALIGFAHVLALGSAAPALFLLAGQKRLGRRWPRSIPSVMLLVVVGSGLMLNTARAVAAIWLHPNAGFERTAKFGHRTGSADAPVEKGRYRLSLDPIVIWEIALGIYSLACAWFAFHHSNIGVTIYAAIFGIGLLAVAGLTIQQHLKLWVTMRTDVGDAERSVPTWT